jgi:hypothetical protein
LKGTHTAEALQKTVTFSRTKGVTLDKSRTDNQSSPELRSTALNLVIKQIELVASNQKEPNRAERAIQTAKNHIIASRAGFHRDCPHMYLDKCLPQIEQTIKILHSYEYDPRISAYPGIFGAPFDFMTHPIAPVGSKVLTWDSPDTRGSWSDHGTAGIYVGPTLDHFRAFRIWVPENSAMRISSTVWWFLADDSLLSLPSNEVSYLPTRTRSNPQPNGADLLGRFFFEPDLGVCCVTRLGPIARKQMSNRSQQEQTNRLGISLHLILSVCGDQRGVLLVS